MTTLARQLSSSSMEGVVTDIGYDSYQMAWRYLGAYTDCSSSSWWKWWGGSRRRRRLEDAQDDDGTTDADETCGGTRKLLWAAYVDANYTGEQIGEYQYYADGAWDDSTCTGDRCVKMDCHDPYQSTNTTTWELLGVYKETVSFSNDNFFEQLFKHQGYCLWNGDQEDYDSSEDSDDAWKSSSYQFMQAMRQELPEGCTEVEGFSDGYGSDTHYVDIKPQAEGQMSLGVYTDSTCAVEADWLAVSDYQYYAASSLTATASSSAFDTWNENMDSYKICQPCRAYNREATYYSGSDSSDSSGSSDSGDRRRRKQKRRQLTEYYDGYGAEEQNGFNCYDDAHYRNCNQCYKFETHTDMATASASDLEMASAQGTILAIEYDGVWYGKGTAGDVPAPTRPPTPAPTTPFPTQPPYVQAYESASEAYASASEAYASASAAYASASGASTSASDTYESASAAYESATETYATSNSAAYESASETYATSASAAYDSSSDAYSSVASYSFAGGVSLLLVGLALGGYRKATRRRITLASEGMELSTKSPPLV